MWLHLCFSDVNKLGGPGVVLVQRHLVDTRGRQTGKEYHMRAEGQEPLRCSVKTLNTCYCTLLYQYCSLAALLRPKVLEKCFQSVSYIMDVTWLHLIKGLEHSTM